VLELETVVQALRDFLVVGFVVVEDRHFSAAQVPHLPVQTRLHLLEGHHGFLVNILLLDWQGEHEGHLLKLSVKNLLADKHHALLGFIFCWDRMGSLDLN